MQTGTGGKGSDHRSRHRLAGQQIASGNTADTGGKSVGSQNVGTGEMRDITRKVDKRHLPVIAVGAVSHNCSKRRVCRRTGSQLRQHLGTDRRVGNILRGHGTSTGKHMRTAAADTDAAGGDGYTRHVSLGAMSDNRKSHASGSCAGSLHPVSHIDDGQDIG